MSRSSLASRLGALAVAASAFALGACSSDGGGAVTATVAVEGTADACTPAQTSVAAGRIQFAFTNKADQVSELYVKDAGGKIKSEVENVGKGVTRNLTVKLAEGAYQLVCKPGEKGDGIATPFTVTA